MIFRQKTHNRLLFVRRFRPPKSGHFHRINVYYIYLIIYHENQPYSCRYDTPVPWIHLQYLYLPGSSKGCWMDDKGCRKTPSLRLQTAPFGRCWYMLVEFHGVSWIGKYIRVPFVSHGIIALNRNCGIWRGERPSVWKLRFGEGGESWLHGVSGSPETK